MKQWILKEDVLEEVKTDQVLYGKVAKALNVHITSMPRILAANSPKLTQISVLEAIATHLKKKQNDLIEPSTIAA